MTCLEQILHNFGRNYAKAMNEWLIAKGEKKKKELVKKAIKRIFYKGR